MAQNQANGHLATLAERILANQSDKRRRVNEAMAAVMNHHVKTANDDVLIQEKDRMMDSLLLERGLQPGAPPPPGMVRGGRALLVTGPAGAGKSSAILNLLNGSPEFEGFGVDGAYCPIVSLNAPSPLTLRQLGNAILRAVSYPAKRQLSESEVWPVVHEQLRANGICFVHIDEMQHTDEITSEGEFQKIENTLKEMMQQKDWPVWLILSGLPELKAFFAADPSMRRRVRVAELGSLSFPDDADAVRKIVGEFLDLCPGLTAETLLADTPPGDEFVARLIHASMNQFGILAEFVQDGIREALEFGDGELDAGHFADVYAARTGSPDEANVFLAPRWEAIDVASAMLEDEVDDEGARTGRRIWKTRKGVKR